MKFQKTYWVAQQELHDDALRHACIPYKQWKKAIKYHRETWTLKVLLHQCALVDAQLKQGITPRSSGISWRCCGGFGRRLWLGAGQGPASSVYRGSVVVPIPSPAELLRFAEINATAVYKICKKLTKTKHTPEAMAFLAKLRNEHRFTFLGSDLLTRLRFEIPTDPIDRTCPICFEDIHLERPALVLPCGHYQCFTCFTQMTHFDTIPATFYNRLLIVSRSFHCPLCRHCPLATPLTRRSFWPRAPLDPTRKKM